MEYKLIPKDEAISNEDIEKICHRYGIQLNAVCMKDQLDALQTGNYIINLQNHNQSGSHWVALVIQPTECMYCDSFGAVPPQQIQELLQKYYKKIPFNNFIIQDLNNSSCGYFCMVYLLFVQKHRYNGKSLLLNTNDYINLFFDDTTKNFAVLKKLAKKLTKGK